MLFQTIATVLMVALLLCGTMFLNVSVFVEAQMISKWYALIAVALGCLLILPFTSGRKLTMDIFSFALFAFVGWILLRGFFSDIIEIKVLLFLSFIFLYLFFKDNYICRQNIDALIVLVCLAQAIYGILQYLGWIHVSGIFKVIGSFDNPAGFAASLAVGFPFCFSLKNSKISEWFGWLAAAIIATAVVSSDSRAGMIALILCTGIYFIPKIKHVVRHKRKYIIAGITFFLIVAAALFIYKKDSSLGRALIWRNSVNMISDKPVAGHGSGSFMAEYMTYQADYFANNPDSPFLQLADNVSHPFNEYLLLTVEYGLIGVLLLAFIVIILIRSTKRITPEILSLLSVAAFACFSYPFRYAFVIAVAAYCLTGINAGRQIHFSLKGYFICALLALGVLCGILFARDISFEKQWGKLAKRSFRMDGGYFDTTQALYDKWNGNPYFLYNYGAVLNSAKRYDESNEIFSECVLHLNDYDVQMLMADNSMKMERWNDAEKHYTLASNMIPNRFKPLDRLMEVYQEMGEQEKTLEVARQIVDKKIKIQSGTVSNIKNKAQKIIDEVTE